MPRYTYSCTFCGHTFDAMELVRDRNKVQECPQCGKQAQRDVEAELSEAVVGDEGDRIRESRALGCPASQIDDFRKLHPGAEFVKRGSHYNMIVHGRREKKRRMKERHYEEFDPRYDT